jgi:hypothetical protein
MVSEGLYRKQLAALRPQINEWEAQTAGVRIEPVACEVLDRVFKIFAEEKHYHEKSSALDTTIQ